MFYCQRRYSRLLWHNTLSGGTAEIEDVHGCSVAFPVGYVVWQKQSTWYIAYCIMAVELKSEFNPKRDMNLS